MLVKLALLFFVLIVFSYEFVGINEDFLFLVSFSIFFYGLVMGVSGLLVSELGVRRSQLFSSFNFLLDFKGSQLFRYFIALDYLRFQDLEKFAIEFINSIAFSSFYRFCLDETLAGVVFTRFSYLLGSPDLDYALFTSFSVSHAEESVNQFVLIGGVA